MIGAQISHAEPREVVVEVPPGHAVAGSFTGAQVPSTPAGISGFQRLNMSGAGDAPQLAPAAQLVQAVDGQRGTSR